MVPKSTLFKRQKKEKNMDHFTMRLPTEVISKIEAIAEDLHIPPRTLVRAWIMQRLDEEGVE